MHAMDALCAQLVADADSASPPLTGQVPEPLCSLISQILATLFADGSPENWSALLTALNALRERKVALRDLTEQVEHYLQRLAFQLQFSNLDDSLASRMNGSIKAVFPQYRPTKFTQQIPDYSYKSQKTVSEKKDESGKRITKANIDVFNKYGGSQIYDSEHERIRERMFKPKQDALIKISDVNELLPLIGLQAALEETHLGSKLDAIQNTLFTCLDPPATPVKDSGSIADLQCYKMPKEPVALHKKPQPKRRDAPEYKVRPAVDNGGRGQVEHLMEARHLQVAKFVYLAPRAEDRPYELHIVPGRVPADSPHYVMSAFGVLRVEPADGGTVEAMSLADWHREASIYGLLRNIRFFATFKERKALHQLRRCAALSRMGRVRLFLEDRLLPAKPAFATALCHVMKLLQELATLGVVPHVRHSRPLSLMEFEELCHEQQQQLSKVVDKLYRYILVILTTTRDKILAKLQVAEEKAAAKPKPHVKNISLSQQKEQKAEAAHRLVAARKEALMLGNLVLMMERITLEHLVSFTRTQVHAFIAAIIEAKTAKGSDSPPTSRDVSSHLMSSLTFTADSEPTISPSMSAIGQHLGNAVTGLVDSIAQVAVPFGATVNPQLDSSRNLPPRQTRQPASTPGGKLTRPDGPSLLAQMDSASLASRSVASEQLLALSNGSGLEIVAEGFVGQYEVLTWATDFCNRLQTDEVVETERGKLHQSVHHTEQQVDALCLQSRWLIPVHKFVTDFSQQSHFDQLTEGPLPDIKEALLQIKRWLSECEMNAQDEIAIHTPIVCVKQDIISTHIVTTLNDIFNRILRSLTQKAEEFVVDFVEQSKEMLSVLKSRGDTMHSAALFAGFVSQVNVAQSRLADAKPRLEECRERYAVIRSARPLTAQETSTMQEAQYLLSNLQAEVQNASEFANQQKPNVQAALRENHQRNTDKLRELLESASQELYLVVPPNGSEIGARVRELDDLKEKSCAIYTEMERDSKYFRVLEAAASSANQGDTVDMGEARRAVEAIASRREVWKYVQVAHSAIAEWTEYQFRKLNIGKTREKLQSWQGACRSPPIATHVPESDGVVQHLLSLTQGFLARLEGLQRLQHICASDKRRWRQVLLAATNNDDINDLHTVSQIIRYNVLNHV